MGCGHGGCPALPGIPGRRRQVGRGPLQLAAYRRFTRTDGVCVDAPLRRTGREDTLTAAVDGLARRFHNEDPIDFRSWLWIHD
jgi:hypothetical protein